MQFYPPLKINGTEYSTIQKPVVLALSARAHLEFDTVKRALARLEQMKPADTAPKTIYCFETTGWKVVQHYPRIGCLPRDGFQVHPIAGERPGVKTGSV
jgi:hypothetical protein